MVGNGWSIADGRSSWRFLMASEWLVHGHKFEALEGTQLSQEKKLALSQGTIFAMDHQTPPSTSFNQADNNATTMSCHGPSECLRGLLTAPVEALQPLARCVPALAVSPWCDQILVGLPICYAKQLLRN